MKYNYIESSDGVINEGYIGQINHKFKQNANQKFKKNTFPRPNDLPLNPDTVCE